MVSRCRNKKTFQRGVSVGGIAMERLEELSARIKKFNEDRDWDQFHTPSNLAKTI